VGVHRKEEIGKMEMHSEIEQRREPLHASPLRRGSPRLVLLNPEAAQLIEEPSHRWKVKAILGKTESVPEFVQSNHSPIAHTP
jgi:hypothetical protein